MEHVSNRKSLRDSEWLRTKGKTKFSNTKTDVNAFFILSDVQNSCTINSTSLTAEVLKSTLEVSEGEGPFLYCFASEEGKMHALEAYKLSIFLLGFPWKGKSKRATLGSALGPDSPCGGVKLLCIAHSFPYELIKDKVVKKLFTI